MHGTMHLTPEELEDRVSRIERALAVTPLEHKLEQCSDLCSILYFDALQSIACGNGGKELAEMVLQKVKVTYDACLVEIGRISKGKTHGY